MLRKWHPPTAVSFLADEVREDVDDVVTWKEDNDGRPQIGSQLSPAQFQDIEEILQEFSEVLCSKPGWTTVTEHQIDTGQTSPVRLPPYRLPHAYKVTVREELKEMEQSGVLKIEHIM